MLNSGWDLLRTLDWDPEKSVSSRQRCGLADDVLSDARPEPYLTAATPLWAWLCWTRLLLKALSLVSGAVPDAVPWCCAERVPLTFLDIQFLFLYPQLSLSLPFMSHLGSISCWFTPSYSSHGNFLPKFQIILSHCPELKALLWRPCSDKFVPVGQGDEQTRGTWWTTLSLLSTCFLSSLSSQWAQQTISGTKPTTGSWTSGPQR